MAERIKKTLWKVRHRDHGECTVQAATKEEALKKAAEKHGTDPYVYSFGAAIEKDE